MQLTFEQIKEKLSGKTVGIAGAGGLGSNCAIALARVGVGKLIISDFDVVSQSNLNRQYYFFNQIGKKKVIALQENILNINSSVEVEIHDIKLDSNSIKNIYFNCDILVEAFDMAEMKQMMIETALEFMPDKPVVCGVGMAGWGESDTIKPFKTGNLIICGDQLREVDENMPAIAPRVGIVSNMMANEVLKILLGEM